MTNHMWSGFNLMANLALWRKLPDDIKAVIESERRPKYVRQQRRGPGRTLNARLRASFTDARPWSFNEVDQAAFRARLSGRLCRPGRRSSAANAGGCWRPRSGSSADRRSSGKLHKSSDPGSGIVHRLANRHGCSDGDRRAI